MTNTDVLIIGAGPAGAVAGSIVNKNGFDVIIVEKTRFPRFVIGESLLPRCMESLEEAGFLSALKTQGYQEKYGAKFVKNGRICDFNFSENFTPGYTWTWQVPRDHFDRILTSEIQKIGIPLHFETTVTNIEFNKDYSIITTNNAENEQKRIKAKFIIDASGYGRVIPRLLNLEEPSNLPPRKSIFAHLQDTRRNDAHEPNRITIFLHKPDVWIWVIPFSDGRTSVGFVGNSTYLSDDKMNDNDFFDNLMMREPELAERFKDCKKTMPVTTLSSWSVKSKQLYGPGFVLAGNATEFLDPVFSSGVTLATVSGALSAQLVCRQLRNEVVDWQKEYTDYMMKGIDVFRSYVEAWYNGDLQDIFFAKNPIFAYQKQICSVLAGYVWDESNPFVKNHNKVLGSLAKVLKGEHV